MGPYRFIGFCPNDEYDGESRMIVDSFRKENDLGKLIYNIFGNHLENLRSVKA